MPLYAGVASVDEPSIVIPWTEDVGTMRATWTDPTGVDWPLSDLRPTRGWFTSDGIAGWGAQPYEIVTDPMSRGGESVRFIRPQPARLTWPLHIYGETYIEFITRYRALRRAFLMTVHRGLPGLLTVALPDGSARCIEAYYEDGWAAQAGENWLFANPVLTLFCPDGSWRDVQRLDIPTVSGGSSVPFNNPFLTISSARQLGVANIVNNPGDVIAWPEWKITGPCTALTATNNTTGQSFTLTHSLSVGQVMTITTDRPTVRGPAGENLSGSLNWPGAYLWGLMPGDNDIDFSVIGLTATTAIDIGFYPRYEGV